MRKLIYCSLVLLFCAVGNAQVITELEEAKVKQKSTPIKAERHGLMGSEYVVVLKETYAGEFEKNPIKFMQSNLNMQDFISSIQNRNHDAFSVTFRTRRGMLKADFSRDGELLNTVQNFKDIPLPKNLQHDLYRDYKGWNMVANTYKANGNSYQIDKETFRIKLKKGKQIQRIVIKNASGNQTAVVAK